jgi:hypothetical protein
MLSTTQKMISGITFAVNAVGSLSRKAFVDFQSPLSIAN